MNTTTTITITVHGDTDLRHTAPEIVALVAGDTGLPVHAVVERAKHIGPLWVSRVVDEVTA
jgi:hypothetical protein